MPKQSFVRTKVKLSALSIFVCSFLFTDQLHNRSYAGAGSAVVTELTELLCRKIGGTVTKKATEKIAVSVEKIVARFGDDGFKALRKVGPVAIRSIESAGDAAPACVKLMAKHGDEAIWIVAKPTRLTIFVKYGDDAANAMLRHNSLAEPIIERFGGAAASALVQVTSQNGRRLAILNNSGFFDAVQGQSPRLFDVIKKHGDGAADIIWKNKGALAVSATLTAFLLDPEPFIDGTKQLGAVAIGQVVAPLADSAAKHLPWKIIGVIAVATMLVYAVGIHNLLTGPLFVIGMFRGSRQPARSEGMQKQVSRKPGSQ